MNTPIDPAILTSDPHELGGPLDNWVTPSWVVEAIVPKIRQRARHGAAWDLVDPGAGIGAITAAAIGAGLIVSSVAAVEIHPKRQLICADRLDALGFRRYQVTAGDWLDDSVADHARDHACGSGEKLVLGNPPYTKPDRDTGLRFILQAIRIASPHGVVALLLPLDFGAGCDRAEQVHDKWRCSCYPLRRRPSFGEKGAAGKRPVAWFVWDLGCPTSEFQVL